MTAPNVLLTVQGVDMCAFTIADVRITVGRRTVYEQPEAGTMNARMVTAAVGGPDGTVLPGSRVEVWMSTAPGGTAPWDGAAVLWSDTATTWDGASWAAPDWRL